MQNGESICTDEWPHNHKSDAIKSDADRRKHGFARGSSSRRIHSGNFQMGRR